MQNRDIDVSVRKFKKQIKIQNKDLLTFFFFSSCTKLALSAS